MMDKYQYRGFTCPVCKTIRTYNHRIYFNSKKDKKELQKLLSGELITVTCPKCENVFYDYGLIYHDEGKNKIVVFDRPESFEFTFIASKFNKDIHYTVSSLNELRDCIFAINHNMNWWIIKLYVLMRLNDFKELCVNKGYKDLSLGKYGMLEADKQNMLYIELQNEDFCVRDVLTTELYQELKNDWFDKAMVYVEEHYYLDDDYALNEIINKE